MKVYKIKPPTYLLIAIFAVVILHFALPVAAIVPFPWNLLGVIPLILGVVINLNADQPFQKANTTVSPFEVSTAWITSGMYCFTRNPMYLGFVLILLGSLTPYMVVFAFAVLMDRIYINMEEQTLSRAFGSAWQEYKSRTRRWL